MAPRHNTEVIAVASDQGRQVIIAGDNYGAISSPEIVPRQLVRQLPFAAPDFTGRSDEVEQLHEWLTARTRPRLVNIYGIPGSGKSTLAVFLGHMMTTIYPDCQLYFNLREARNQQPISPDDLLGGALVALGASAAEMPSDLFLRTTAYRSAVAPLRSLILIDNASDASQVEPLLPGSSDSAVLITSWAPIAELPGIHTISLQPLSDDEAIDMLRVITERHVADSDLPTVREIVRMLGFLPLALRIAGGLLKTRAHWSWQDLLNRLSDRGSFASLNSLKSGTLSVRDTLGLAYRDLDDEIALGYRLLGLAPAATMSRELAHLLVSAGHAHAEETLDQLTVRGLVHIESSSTVRMHDLVWLNARELVNKADDQSVRIAAVNNMIGWSLNQLDTQYLPRLRLSLSLLPPAGDDRNPLLLSQVFVDGGVERQNSGGTTESLATVFPARHRRLLLVARGGAGKTTLVNDLCDQAAVARAQDPDGLVPLIVLVRELRPSDLTTGLEQILVRQLRYRYDLDLHPAALQVALQRGLVFLVLDGLDEVVDRPMRSDIFAVISNFCTQYDHVPVLITSRPYPNLDADLPGFAIANVAPWRRDLIESYLIKLTAATRSRRYSDDIGELSRWISSYSAQGVMSTPLGIQMVATNFYRTGYIPHDFNTLVGRIVDEAIFRREARRGTLFVDPDDLKTALRLVAFTMQSNSYGRALITSQALTALMVAHPDIWQRRQVPPSEGFAALTYRPIVFQEFGFGPHGEKLYGFTHTAFREYFAASYLAQLSPKEFVVTISEHLSDASWEAVVVAAFEFRQGSDDKFRAAVSSIASKLSNPALVEALRVWSDQATSNKA